jgi:hypothetical protein
VSIAIICPRFWRRANEPAPWHFSLNYKHVSKPKALGGMGILNLDIFSCALRLRWLWKSWTGEDHPWKRFDVPCNLADRLLFSASTIVTVGDGKTAKFWHDSWLDDTAPRNLAPHLFELVLRKNKSVAIEINDIPVSGR